MLASLLYLAPRRLIELVPLRPRSSEYKALCCAMSSQFCAAKLLVRHSGQPIERSSPLPAGCCRARVGLRSS